MSSTPAVAPHSAKHASRLSHLAVWLIVPGFIAFVVTAFAGLASMREVLRSSSEGRQTEENMLLIERTLASLMELESAQRGFMLTGKEQFLERYFGGRSRLRNDYPVLKARLETQPAIRDTEPVPIDTLIERRLGQLERVIEQRRETPVPTIDADVARYMRGDQLTADIASELGRLRSIEVGLSALRQTTLDRAQSRTSNLVAAIAFGGSALMFFAMWVALYTSWRRDRAEAIQRQLNESLGTAISERTRELQNANDRIRSFAHELDRSIESERRRLAREVHDQFGQIATGLKMSVSGLVIDHPQLQGPAMDELKGLLDDAVGMARHIASELRPPLLDDLGFEAAADHYAKTVSRTSGMRILVDVLDDESLTPSQANQLFRILQEAVTNVLRHADASEIVVKGEVVSEQYCLVIKDNGKGPQNARPDSSGLRNMRERATMVGGTLEFKAADTRGSQVVACVPLSAKVEA